MPKLVKACDAERMPAKSSMWKRCLSLKFFQETSVERGGDVSSMYLGSASSESRVSVTSSVGEKEGEEAVCVDTEMAGRGPRVCPARGLPSP